MPSDDEVEPPPTEVTTQAEMEKYEPIIIEHILKGIFGKTVKVKEFPTQGSTLEAWADMVAAKADLKKLNALVLANGLSSSSRVKKSAKVIQLVNLLSS